MLGTFSSVKQYLKFDISRVVIDNIVFKLHYRWTFVLLLVATLLITSRQYIGEHIQCISDNVVAPVINTFCFFTPTFTVVSVHWWNLKACSWSILCSLRDRLSLSLSLKNLIFLGYNILGISAWLLLILWAILPALIYISVPLSKQVNSAFCQPDLAINRDQPEIFDAI